MFSDIPASTQYRWKPGDAAPKVFRQPSGNANGNAFDAAGRLVTCEHAARRVSRTETDGTVVTLAERFEGRRLNSPNDVIVARDGAILFTDPIYGLPKSGEGRELPFCGVFRIASDTGVISLITADVAGPNGLALSPDESVLYVVDSERCHVRAFPLRPDGSTGPGDGTIVCDLRTGPGRAPDGMAVDAEDNLYVCGPAEVLVFTAGGRLFDRITPPEAPANLCFGDDDHRTLYITAHTSVYRTRVPICPQETAG